MSVNSSSSIVRFGTFELELQTGELRHAGQRVKIQEQPFQVLATLLEHPGKMVTREELRSKLWPEDTFVDFDRRLNAAIKRLRDALGESADAPVFIETLARRGYRFIAPVNCSSPSVGIGCLALIIIASLVWAVWWPSIATHGHHHTQANLEFIRDQREQCGRHPVPLPPNFTAFGGLVAHFALFGVLVQFRA